MEAKKTVGEAGWNCDQSRRQGELGHNQQNCGAVESMYVHGFGNRRCQLAVRARAWRSHITPQHPSARHGTSKPLMPRESRNALANTPASSQSHVSQSRDSVVLDDHDKPTQLFEPSSRTCTFNPIHLLISVYFFSASVFCLDPWLIAAPQ